MRVKLDDEILLSVEKPARYTGNELNMVKKIPEDVLVRFAFCFPDVYEIGMSHLGMKILYHVLNERQDTYCERVFAPWVDMEQKMRENEIPLFSLETKDAVRDFDILGFTLQYEMSYSNVLNMLDLAGIPLKAIERKEGMPFVCAGGPCAFNPEPLADFIDFFMIGEGEEVINEVIDIYSKWKSSGAQRETFLLDIASIEGVYVPSLFEVEKDKEGKILNFFAKKEGIRPKIKKRIIRDFENVLFPEAIIVPYIGIVHDRIMLEIFRGCMRGCRFCQAGYIYRPVREKSPNKLLEIAGKLCESTGYDEISLTSLSTSDYTGLGELADGLIENLKGRGVNLSLPSLRVDNFSLALMEKVSEVRKSGLTFAPEAGSQRLRDVINKNVTEEDILTSVSNAFQGGYTNVKLYFMLGLPTETDEDIEQIAILTQKILAQYDKVPREKRGKSVNVTVSTSFFVPKPHTPFQWEAQITMDEMKRRQKYLESRIKSKRITYNWHDPKVSFIEGVIARGDRQIGEVLYQAFKAGCKFDGWNEHFKFYTWLEAFKIAGIDPQVCNSREREFDEILPWDHIQSGVTKNYLICEANAAKTEKTSLNCREKCTDCGVSSQWGGICFD